jgi:toxin ParE1/3/4
VPERYAVAWSDTAQVDLESILEYVARRDGVTHALTLYQRIRDKVEALKQWPRRARVVPELKALGLEDFREIIVEPYRAFFRIDGRTVVLLGVVDGRRDLGELLLERAVRSSGRLKA